MTPPTSKFSGMRLLAYTDNVALGGADISMSHLLAHLDPSIEVTVMGVSPAIAERIASARAGASALTVPGPISGHDWRSLAAHIRAIRRVRPDIVHANLSSPWSCQYAIAAAEAVRRPRIVAVYHLAVPAINERQRWTKRATAGFVDVHVGVGERMARDVERLARIRAHGLRTIHNGVPDIRGRPIRRVVDGPLIGTIGRVEHQKGLDVLLSALTAVDDATLQVIGDGTERSSLEADAKRLGIQDRVIWTGWQDDAQRYLRGFDVLVLPSRREGFPLVLLEALLQRSAVVACDVGSVSEAVIDGETGLLVPAEDRNALAEALRRALASPALRRRLGEQGRRRVLERFTVERMRAGFESLYAELLL
jgi:glycosyltransferase involved in cell wall biosynthesis